MGQAIKVRVNILDEDGKTNFVAMKLDYENVPREGVLLFEREFLAFQNRMLEVAEQVQSSKTGSKPG